MKLGIIGGGKVGCCLAKYLEKHLVGITASTSIKTKQLAQTFKLSIFTNPELVDEAEVILLTVPDRKIEEVAKALTKTTQVQGKIFLHCSGSLGLEPLQALKEKDAYVGSLHPLQSFAGSDVNLTNVYMAIDGDETAQAFAKNIATLLGGKPFYVPTEERALYHAAACICSNYAVTVEVLAQKLMSRWLGNDEDAWQALLPLFKGTATNLQAFANPAQALTGPIARGDDSTIAKHLQVLPDEIVPFYCTLGIYTAHLALTNGTIDTSTATKLKKILEETNARKTSNHLNN